MKLSTKKSRRLLVVIIIIATFLRLASALYLGNQVEPLPGTHDQVSYDALAIRVVNGFGFSFDTGWWPATKEGEPTAHWSFLYTAYLAAVYAVFGVNPLAARLIQALAAGILHPWLSWRIGNRLFGRRVGLIAAALSSIYAYFIYYAAALMTESFYILCILMFLDIATAIGGSTARPEKRSNAPGGTDWIPFLFLGFSLGAAVLLRQLLLLFVPFLFFWLWWRQQESRKDLIGKAKFPSLLTGLGLVILVLVLMIAPWTLRNYLAFNQFVILNTNAGYAFFWGNHPVHGDKFIPILPSSGKSYQELIPTELRSLNEAALERALLRQGIKFVRDDPIRFFWLSVSRAREYFKFWPSSDSTATSNTARVLSFGICLPFMLIGLSIPILNVIFRNRVTGRDMGSACLLGLFVFVYTLIHLFSWTLIRYRLPVDAILIIFAALGITAVLESTSRAKETPQPEPAGSKISTGEAEYKLKLHA